MPELPEVETIARTLAPSLIGRVIAGIDLVYRPLLRGGRPGRLRGLIGRRVLGVRRRGKMLLVEIEGCRTLVFHLKMTGQFLFAAAPEPRATNLPLRRSFVPLMTQMVSYLAGGGAADADHHVGAELLLLRGGWDANQPVYAVRPDGGRFRAAVRVVGAEPQAYLAADTVDQSGFYQLEAPSAAAAARSASTHNVFAANAPRSESVPRAADPAELETRAGRWRLRIVDAGRGSGIDDEQTRTSLLTAGPAGRGIWDALLWTVLILVLLEPLIANRIRGPRKTESPAAARRAA